MAFAAVPAAGSLIGGSALAAGVLPVAATTAATAGIGLGSAVGAGTFLNAMRIVGGIAQGVSAIQQGNAQQQQSNFQTQQLAQQQERERQIGEQEVEDFRRRAASRQATANAQLGAMGITSTGSPTLAEEDFLAEIEVQAARIKGASDAKQQRLQSEEELERFSSRTTGKRTALSAIGAGLSGLGKVNFGKA